MPRLIHLNGSPGVGKSTLAQRYVDEHPGVLDLDADVVLSLIGGWQVDFFATLAPARNLALAMAGAHLRTGHDVVVPQLVTSLDEAHQLEACATEARAGFVEVALVADPEEQVIRFRSKSQHSPVHGHVAQAVDARGGDALLRKIDSDFRSYLAHRPGALRLDTSGSTGSDAYTRLLALLAPRHQ